MSNESGETTWEFLKFMLSITGVSVVVLATLYGGMYMAGMMGTAKRGHITCYNHGVTVLESDSEGIIWEGKSGLRWVDADTGLNMSSTGQCTVIHVE